MDIPIQSATQRGLASRFLRLLVAMALPLMALSGHVSAGAAERGLAVPVPTSSQEDPTGARVIVRFKSTSSTMQARKASAAFDHPKLASLIGKRTGYTLRDGRALDGRTQVVRGDKSISSADLAKRIAADPDVEFAVPDLRRKRLSATSPNDPLYPSNVNATGSTVEVGQWYLRAPTTADVDGNPNLSAINAAGAWSYSTGSSSIVVADVDTGVITTHPDLVNKLLPGYNFVTPPDSSGREKGWGPGASDPGDWVTQAEATACGSGQTVENSSWHGTQVMGLIGAQTDNSIGMASVGPQIMLLPVRALTYCGGYDSDIVAGMLWAAGIALPNDANLDIPSTGAPTTVNPNPANVINLSLGGSGSCSNTLYATYLPQILAKNIVVVAAAGNDEGLTVGVPANCTGVLAVAAIRSAGTKVGFSNIGTAVAISAPGGNCINTTGACLRPLLTTTNTGTTVPATNTYSDNANPSLGTSFATPLVSGTVALMLSVNPSLTPAQIKTMLQSSATRFPVQPSVVTSSTAPVCQAPTSATQDECFCTTSTCGAGMLNTFAAVGAAGSRTTAIAPLAFIGLPATTVTAGSSAALNATSSLSFSGKTIASYAWSVTQGSNIASIASGATSANATLLATSAGAVTVSLTVTDSAGLSSTNTQSLTIGASTVVSLPTAVIGDTATTVVSGNSISLNATASTASTGQSLTGYAWTITSGSADAQFTSSTNASTVTLKGTAAGSVTVGLTVTDSAGKTASASQVITVTAPTPPTAVITASQTSITAGNSVSLAGTSSTAAGSATITSYSWSITSGGTLASFSGATNTSSATLVTSAAGSVTVALTVTDSNGQTNTASTVITIAAPAQVTSSSSGGGGGGGAFSPIWLALLGLACVALRPRRSA